MLVLDKPPAVILRLKKPEKVTEIIPTAQVLTVQGKQLVAVPHRPDETTLLRNLGFKVPSPILTQYHWGERKPFEVQVKTAEMLTHCPRAFVTNEIGTGKTSSVLWAYDFLRKKRMVKRMLVIAPLSTLERTWADEIFRWFPHLNYSVLHGSREKRLALLEEPAHIYIINHHGLEIVREALAKRPDIDLIVADEFSIYRNKRTDLWNTANEVVNKQCPRRLWGMTGTPTPNAPTDAYGQLKLMMVPNVPRSFTAFRDLTMRQVSTFRWVPRDDAIETVASLMQPAVRYTRDQCMDLPPIIHETRHAELSPEQAKAYKQMQQKLRAEFAQGEIIAVNEAVKASKLLQIACLKYDTPVLTTFGWKRICEITAKDVVWDGEAWVTQLGAVYKGHRELVECFGVEMTADHKVLTRSGWREAQEVLNGESSKKLDRAKVRLPDGCSTSRNYDWYKNAMCNMVMPVRLWESSGAAEPVSTDQASKASEELRVPPRQRNPQDEQDKCVLQLGGREKSLPQPQGQRLQKLWRKGHCGLRAMARVIRELLGRHGADVCTRAHPGACRQQRAVLQRELSLGNCKGASQEPSLHGLTRHAGGADVHARSSRTSRDEKEYARSKDSTIRVVGSESLEYSRTPAPVYDLINCGPRNRFVVRGKDGAPLIVHNCGCSYAEDGSVIVSEARSRLSVVDECLAEAEGKVIVFVPFVSSVTYVAEHLRKQGIVVECIHGGVPKGERDRIFGEFQNGTHVQVLVAQPAACSHGLTLTAASVIVWYGPVTSNEVYTQANGRISRPSQTRTQVIVHIEGTALERLYYQRLLEKGRMEGLLLEILKSNQV